MLTVLLAEVQHYLHIVVLQGNRLRWEVMWLTDDANYIEINNEINE